MAECEALYKDMERVKNPLNYLFPRMLNVLLKTQGYRHRKNRLIRLFYGYIQYIVAALIATIYGATHEKVGSGCFFMRWFD